MKVCLISDTHGYFPDLPDADILVHCGDATSMGYGYELSRFDDWLFSFKDQYQEIIFVPGNHDIMFEKNPETARAITKSMTVLINESITINGKKIYGSPMTPTFGHGWAFNRNTGVQIQAEWDKIPDGLDLLITHGPPYNILDVNRNGQNCGCVHLDYAVKKKNPRFHAFGHIHLAESDKKIEVTPSTTYINAATCNESYRPVNPPIVIEI
jgi:Icc-related predicted phosphoesterase